MSNNVVIVRGENEVISLEEIAEILEENPDLDFVTVVPDSSETC